uniref:Alpha/beta hydrolase n=1 Tax=Streptomyces fradiae TaxID=1906 RepID=Q45R94_STRFR|nr:hypothetical protein [Streptomyces fradiae]
MSHDQKIHIYDFLGVQGRRVGRPVGRAPRRSGHRVRRGHGNVARRGRPSTAAASCGVSQGTRDAFWLQSMAAGRRNAHESIAAFSATDFRADLARFDVPTLVIHGEADQVVPIEVGDTAQLGALDPVPRGPRAHGARAGLPRPRRRGGGDAGRPLAHRVADRARDPRPPGATPLEKCSPSSSWTGATARPGS